MDQIYRWQQEGTISLWHYRVNTRSFRGWHLSADDAGCRSLLSLVDALVAAPPGTMRTVRLTAPSTQLLSVPNNRGSSVDAPTRLRLLSAGANDAWRWDLEDARLTLELGANHAFALKRGLLDIAAGNGDYNMAPNNNADPLWFWWWAR
jgi:hypothetical protein